MSLLEPSGGERSLFSAFGRWCRHVEFVLTTPGAIASVRGAVDLLSAAGGEVSLTTPEGRWALALSRELDSGSFSPSNLLNLLFVAPGGISQFFRWKLLRSLLSLVVGVFPLGDSYTEGLRGDTGGWRARMTTSGWLGVGPYRDPTNRNHGGVGGETLVDMQARVSQLADYPNQEVWLEGGTNDMIGAASSAVTETNLNNLLGAIDGAVSAPPTIRIMSLPPVNTATDPTILDYNKRLQRVADAQRVLGRKVYFHDCGGYLTAGDLDGIVVEHPVDGVYGLGSGSGYGKWAAYFDRWFNSSLAKSPDEIAGLQFWFEADDVVVSSGRITQANDKSGNGRHAAEVGGSGPALISGSVFSGLAMNFNGTTNLLRTADTWTVAQPNTVIVVAGPVQTTVQPILFDSANAAARQVLWTSAANLIGLYAGASAFDPYTLGTVGHFYLAEFNGASSEMMINGSLRRSVAFSPGAQGLQGVTLGASVAGSNFAQCEIYGAWGYNAQLTDEDRFALAMYARNKWGIWPLLGGL